MVRHSRRMLGGRRQQSFKHREQRQPVVLQARIRGDRGWGDACILNVSSRGLLAYSHSPAEPGSIVELRRGEQVIVAQVMWRQHRRIGLRSQDPLKVEEIVSGSKSANLEISAPQIELARYRTVRREEESRARGRLGEFASLVLVGAALAGLGYTVAAEMLSAPLARVSAALGRH